MAEAPKHDEAAPDEWGRLGAFIRSQRKLKELSQRELAKLTDLSDPYVSQIERGMHQPSVKVLKSLATALNVRVETMLVAAGLLDHRPTADDVLDTETAIRVDPRLTEEQKLALLSVHRSYVTANAATGTANAATNTANAATNTANAATNTANAATGTANAAEVAR